jgi:hypothetical protein
MTPTAVPTTLDHDRMVLETLKEIHNKGATLYNEGDHGGALRLYQGGLIVAKPLLAHRTKQQTLIEEGLTQIDKASMDAKVKAFRLHEVIEQTREELKAAIKARETPAVAPQPKAPEAAVAGNLLFNGKPANGVTVSLVLVGTTKVLAFGKTGPDGGFNISSSVPVGAYHITLTGEGIPVVYTKPETTPLKQDLKPDVNHLKLEAKQP